MPIPWIPIDCMHCGEFGHRGVDSSHQGMSPSDRRPVPAIATPCLRLSGLGLVPHVSSLAP